jgi:CheY-like chemotaxis protein
MKKVLVADDRATGRELVRTVLERGGFEVIEAANGKEALEQAGQAFPDLIILDIHMPGMDGFEVVQALRQDERFAKTPVIALTASAMMGDREKALKLGFTGYMTKPIQLSALREEVHRLLP